MHDITTLRQFIDKGLQDLPLDKAPQGLYAPIRYTLELGGKRMRPVLVLLACEMMDGNWSAALPPALGVELFHNFTLLHDDIMDQAPLRRGKPTVYKKYDTNTAILSGDVMYTIACQQMAAAPISVLKPVLDVFHQTAVEVCEGQQYDMDFEQTEQVSIADYLHMITLKTAVLVGASLQIGALVGGATADAARAFYEVGLHLGIAFQLQDDILDTYGDPDKFGKQVGGDIMQNKKTYLLLQTMQQASPEQRASLDKWLTDKPADPKEKVKAVTALYNQLSIREQAEAERDSHYAKALHALSGISISDDRKAPLLALAARLLHRDH